MRRLILSLVLLIASSSLATSPRAAAEEFASGLTYRNGARTFPLIEKVLDERLDDDDDEKPPHDLARERTATAPALAPADTAAANKTVWRPTAGAKWQVVIKNNISVNPFAAGGGGGFAPTDVQIIDVDLFNTPAEVFAGLHARGKKIICYFSAGTSEEWRPDYKMLQPGDMGEKLGCWPGERYLNIRSERVFQVMLGRIKMAAERGCDALDPDNMGKLKLESR
jgi:hypothetical protein